MRRMMEDFYRQAFSMTRASRPRFQIAEMRGVTSPSRALLLCDRLSGVILWGKAGVVGVERGG